MHYISQQNDWLVQPFCQPASVAETDNRLILDNGLNPADIRHFT